LLLGIPSARTLAVFDANEAQVVRYVPLPDAKVLIAGGMDQFFVAIPEKNVLQRWSLTTFERELSTPLLPGPGTVRGFAMGSASRGPLVIGIVPPHRHEDGSFLFVDPTTMKPRSMKWTNTTGPDSAPRSRPLFADSWYLRASSDGTLFTLRPGIGGEPHEVFSIAVSGDRAAARHTWMSASVLRPSHDGTSIFAPDGIYGADFQHVWPRNRPAREDSSMPLLPATQGDFFVRLQPQDEQGLGAIHVHVPGIDQSLARLDKIDGVFRERVSYGKSHDSLTHDQRVHYIAEAKILVTIPSARDRLNVYRLDVEKLVEASGIDYLFVASAPPSFAQRGHAYHYRINAKSKKGGLNYKLDLGPTGMSIDATGKVVWMVPSELTEREVNVIISVRDSSAQEVLQSFKISVDR
jgi:hypothetical protein